MATKEYLFAMRLNFQHFLWREVMGYLIHPAIPTTFPRLAVVDIGTGTAAWLVNLANLLPSSTQLDGFDVKDIHYPHKDYLETNVTLGIMDIMDGPPQHLHEKYDIVHIRFFSFEKHATNPKGLLINCLKLLKPGGYIQWDEFDAVKSRVISSPNAIRTGDVESLNGYVGNVNENRSAVDAMTDNRDDRRWVGALGGDFLECGLEEVKLEVRPEPCAIMPISSELLCVVCEEYASTIPDQRTRDELCDMSRKAHAEMRQGVTVSKALQTVIGKKPQRRRQHHGSAYTALNHAVNPEVQDGPASMPKPVPSLKKRARLASVPTPAPSSKKREKSASMPTPAHSPEKRDKSVRMPTPAPIRMEQDKSVRMPRPAPSPEEQDKSARILTDAPIQVEEDKSARILTDAPIQVEQDKSARILTDAPIQVEQAKSVRMPRPAPSPEEQDKSASNNLVADSQSSS